MQIREFREADLSAVVAVHRDAYPHWLVSERSMRHFLRVRPERARYRLWVADEGGGIVGTASASLHVYAERLEAGFARVTVRDDRRRRGTGGALLEQALAHLGDCGARRALADTVSDDGRRFLERHGFRHTMTRRYSRVDPRELDFDDLPDIRTRKAAEGFRVVPLAECRPEDIHAVDAEASRDVPFDEPITHIPFDEWLQSEWRHPHLTLDGSFAVVHGGRPVTMATLGVEPETRRAVNYFTGTLRAVRGRGLARLAKLCQLEWAAARGFTSVLTDNDETNAPMLAVNTRLGYRPFLQEWAYVRDLEP